LGETVRVHNVFDGWGYVHLFDRATLAELDTFAIPEGMDPAYAAGFGDLTVHEVATHPVDPDRAYLSYYAGGVRALGLDCIDAMSCDLVEVGGYLDPEGNDFWGVEAYVAGGTTYVLASDMDHGLWVFRDRGP
jgi:hypothetical protein